MARLVQLSASAIEAARPGFEPMPILDSGWKIARPSDGGGLDPMFELLPRRPSFDTRVSGDGPGVAAVLETFGAITGPRLAPALDQDQVVLGGNPVVAGTHPPFDVGELRRQCGARLSIVIEQLDRRHQLLVMFVVAGYDEPVAQVFLGRTALTETPIFGEERLAVLADPPLGGELHLDLRLRLAASSADARLVLRAVQGFLL